jgi:hypothetical protein
MLRLARLAEGLLNVLAGRPQTLRDDGPRTARGEMSMSLSGAHRAAFRREAAGEGRVYSIRDDGGLPAPSVGEARTVPFWSKPTRAGRMVDQVEAYRGFQVISVDVDEWLNEWLPRFEADGMLVGVNWAGARATGYDLTPAQVKQWFENEPAEGGNSSTRR